MSFYAHLFDRILKNWNILQLLLSIELIFEDKNCIRLLGIRNKISSGRRRILVPGTKIIPSRQRILLPGIKKIVPGSHKDLLHIQHAGYNITTAPFSSRPGGYKGAIDWKNPLVALKLWSSLFSWSNHGHVWPLTIDPWQKIFRSMAPLYPPGLDENGAVAVCTLHPGYVVSTSQSQIQSESLQCTIFVPGTKIH